MAGSVLKCKGCNQNCYDEETIGMRQRGDLCAGCAEIIRAVKEVVDAPAAPKDNISYICAAANAAKARENSLVGWDSLASSASVPMSGDPFFIDDGQAGSLPDFQPDETLEEFAKNRNSHEFLKMKYRQHLARLTHRDLLEYVVARLDGYERYESTGIVSHAEVYVNQKIAEKSSADKASREPEGHIDW